MTVARTTWIAPAHLFSVLGKVGIIAATLEWAARGQAVPACIGSVCIVLALIPCVRKGVAGSGGALDVLVTGIMAAHVCLGMRVGLYETSAVYDKLAHGTVMACIAGFALQALSARSTRRGLALDAGELAWAAAATTLAIGMLWEVFEFALDQTGLVETQRGLRDTMLDLIADTVGACVGLGVVWLSSQAATRAEPDSSSLAVAPPPGE